jgi:hypothetical protein
MGPGPLLRPSAKLLGKARSASRRIAMLASLAATVVAPNLAFTQSASNFAGDYAGMMGPLRVELHLTAASHGLTCAVDSPDQNMMGVPCAEVHVNGQSLSFTVPAVGGTYTGLLSGDGSSLAGVWSQGAAPAPLTLNRVTAATVASAAPSAPAVPTPNAEVKWDDYTYKFDRSGMMAQVFEGGKVVGTILTMNGQQRILPLPGTDATKMTKSFEDYQAFSARSHSGDTPAVATAPASPAATNTATPAVAAYTPPSPRGSYQVTASPTSPEKIRFDEATHSITVPRPDGITVTFVGEDVKIAGFRRLNYIVRHQKGTAGRFLERNLGHPDAAGASLSGGGEEFLLDGGGLIYDSGMGTNADMQVNSPVLTAKQLSQIAVAAVADVRQVPGHENFAPPGYGTLKEISQYRLRSDGSR